MTSKLKVNLINDAGDNNIITSDGSGVITSSKFKIGQIVSTTKTDTFTTTTISFHDLTGLSLSITPTSTSSKILLSTEISFGGSASIYGFARFVRDSTAIGVGDAGESNQQQASIPMDTPNTSHDIYKCKNSAMTFLDSPSTTSSITYKIQVLVHNTGTLFINRASNNDAQPYNGRYISSLTAMEVLP